jgi:DNA-binding FrmR family transcriptional regulator
MPTLFARLDVGLQGNALSTQLSEQVSNLTAIATTVNNLINRPPSDLSNLTQLIQNLPLPNLEIGGDFAATLTALQQALPTDLSSITNSLTTGLQQLDLTVNTDLTEQLAETLTAVLAIYQLTQTDLLCEDANSANSGETTSSGSPGNSTGNTPSDPATPPPGTVTSSPVLASTLDQVNGSLDLLPSALNVDSFLTWLHQILQQLNLDALGLIQVPVLNDLFDPLDTLLTWRSLSSAEILTQMSGSLETLRLFLRTPFHTVLSPLESDLTAIIAQVSASPLSQITDELTTHLQALKTAIESGNLNGTATTIAAVNTLLDQHQTLQTTWQNNLFPQVEDLRDRLKSLTGNLEDQLGRVVSILQPNSSLEWLAAIADAQPTPTDSQSLSEFQSWLDTIVDWLQKLINAVDLPAIQQPIRTVADGMKAVVDGLDNSLVTVTLAVQNLFSQVNERLAQVDVAAIVQQVETTIQAFKTQLIETLSNLFTPVRAAIGQVITSISASVAAFDPTTVIDALRDAIQVVTGILKDPAVISTLNQIRGALDGVTQQLKTLSFSPIVDQVIAAIDDLAAILSSIDTSLLSTPLQLSLQAALAILPEDLTPVTDPLIAEFGQLIESGPAPLLTTVQQQPQRLLEQVQSFQPAALIGDALSTPYQSLLTDMESFKPSQLLEPVQQPLTTLKTRLQENANPALAIEPLIPLFQNLLQAFDQLKPETLIQPLDDLIQQTIDSVLKALPVDEVFAQVDGATKRIGEVVGLGDRLVALVQRVLTLLNGFDNPQSQIDNWITSALVNLDGITDTSTLQPRLVAVSETLNDLSAAGVSNRFNQSVDALLTVLNTLDPQTRLVNLVQSYRGISQASLNALPDSAEKTALTAALTRFNPIHPSFSAPYQILDTLQKSLTKAKTTLQSDLTDWDDRYHSSNTPLASLKNLTVSPDQLRQWIREAIAGQLAQPLTRLFAMTAPLSQILTRFLTRLQGLVTALQARLTQLLLGPNALGEIRDQIRAILERLQNFNLGFLTESLTDLFETARSDLEAIDPANLAEVIATAFNQVIDSLDLSQILPTAAIAQLDSSYSDVIDKLKTLNPANLVTKAVQPEFEEKVIPLLKTFDLTELLTTLLDRLHQLDDELKAEMTRVNEAYQKLRQSLPSISISVDIDLGISL